MGRPAAPTRGGERVEVVDEQEVHDFWAGPGAATCPAGPDRERVIEDLIGREHLNDPVVAVTDLVVREQGRVVASGQLRVDGATAAVDSVLTDPAAQGRGHADAVLARALDLARRCGLRPRRPGGRADDWPRHWYARRGFENSAPCGPSTDRPDRLRRGRAATAAGRPPPRTAAASPAGPSGRRGRAAACPCP